MLIPGSESSFMQTNYRRTVRTIFDGDYVEAPGCSRRAALKLESSSHALDVRPLLGSDSLLGTTWIFLGAAAGFHFDKRKYRPVVTNHVDLALRVRRTVISTDHDVAVPTQIPIRVCLAAHAGAASLLFRGFVGLRFGQAMPRGELDKAEDCSRNERHRYFRTSSSNVITFPRTT